MNTALVTERIKTAKAPADKPADSGLHSKSPNATPPPAAGEQDEKGARRKKLIRKALPFVGLVVLIALGSWIYEMFLYEETDDAFVTSHVHTVSSRVQGAVVQVLVEDNQRVKRGDPLVILDPREYAAAVKQAQAKYSKAHKDLGRMVSTRGGEDLEDSEYAGGYLPDEKPLLDQYQADALASAAALQTAILHYQFTRIVAPEDGVIGKRSVESGMMVAPGQALMALVEPNPWVVANFKEGQVAKIRVGQKVHIDIDAIPDHKFEGKVESIAPGSGSTFSLLPPDNATGNFTKVVQRIPVKIVIDPESAKGFETRLVPGMSSVVKVRVR